MSGPNPAHLARRGAVYFVRFRIPVDLVGSLGIVEFRRSLLTKDVAEARRRSARASAWFRSTMDQLRSMARPTRADLETAARRHFARLNADLDRPRRFDPDHLADQIAESVELSKSRIDDLEDQLRQNLFDGTVQIAAAKLAEMLGLDIADFSERQAVVAGQLAARAEREQHRRAVHQLLRPGEPMVGDPLFAQGVEVAPPPPASQAMAPVALRVPPEAPSLADLSAQYLRKKELTGVGSSQITELARAFQWLSQEIGGDRPLARVTKEELRHFRDGIARLDVTLRGREAPFRDRQTNVRSNQIKSATSNRYWKSIQAFFAWAVDEGHIDVSPAVGLRIDARKDDVKRTPPPFTSEELKGLFKSPLYAGSLGHKRLLTAGNSHLRQGRWWSGILALFTGLRAGELCQLGVEDFHFDAEVPFLAVTTLDAEGQRTKRTKNESSIRDVPLHPVLFELGLREFVKARARHHRGKRVFFEFRLGSNGRSSEGMTAFWGAYLRKFHLWADGRATHAFRHTFADRLRANGASDEDIGAILGHSGRTITAGYGGVQPLSRKARTLEMLNFGFDVVAALGGSYDPERHGSAQ